MRKFWLVMAHEYAQRVFRLRFLLSVLSLPLTLAFLSFAVILSFLPELNFAPIGCVDYSGLLSKTPATPGYNASLSLVEIIPFDSEDEAVAALQHGQIQAYYVLEANYLQTSQARLISRKKLSDFVQVQFTEFVRQCLLADQPEQVIQRLRNRDQVVMRSADGSRQVGFRQLFRLLAPTAASFGLVLAVFSTSGYTMQAVLEERSNRTMEILVTSVSSLQLLGGKTLGLVGVGLTQLFCWIAPCAVLLLTRLDLLRTMFDLSISPVSVFLLAATTIPTFILIATLMTTFGAVVSNYREASIYTTLINLPIYLPIALAAQILNHPNSPLAVGLSYFPLTASITLNMRSAVTSIPFEQMAISVAILMISALFTLWLAAYIWRLGIQAYGQRLGWRLLMRIRIGKGRSK